MDEYCDRIRYASTTFTVIWNDEGHLTTTYYYLLPFWCSNNCVTVAKCFETEVNSTIHNDRWNAMNQCDIYGRQTCACACVCVWMWSTSTDNTSVGYYYYINNFIHLNYIVCVCVVCVENGKATIHIFSALIGKARLAHIHTHHPIQPSAI